MLPRHATHHPFSTNGHPYSVVCRLVIEHIMVLGWTLAVVYIA